MRDRFYLWITPEGWERIRETFSRIADRSMTFERLSNTNKALTALARKSSEGEEIRISGAPPEVAEAIQELTDRGLIRIVPDLPEEDMWATMSISERLGLTEEEKLKLQRPIMENPEFASEFWLRWRTDQGRN